MTTFADDFERPDGGLANNWVIDSGTASIASGKVTTGVTTIARQTSLNAAERQECICTLAVSTAADITIGPFLKLSTSPRNGYVAYANGTLAAPTWYIRKMTNSLLTTLIQVGGPGISVGSHTVRFLYNSGVLTLWFDGALMMSVADSTYGANTGGGVYSSGTATGLDSFIFYGDEATALTVTPNPIGNYGGTTQVTFTGNVTNWTPGNPGSPIFTVDHGVLSGQIVSSANQATATYTPGGYVGTVTFADPSTAATCQVLVTSDPGVVTPPGGGDTWAPYKTLVDATGTLFSPDWLLTDRSPIIPSSEEVPGTLDIIHAIAQIWNAHFGEWTGADPPIASDMFNVLWQTISGGQAAPPGPFAPTLAMPVQHKLDLLRSFFLNTEGTDYLTLQMVLDAAGSGTPVDLQPILDALGLAGYPLYGSIAEMIRAVRGDDVSSVLGILSELGIIRTNANLTLQSVIDAMPAGSEVDLSPVLTAIANHDTHLTNSTTYIRNDIAGAVILLGALQLGLGDLTDLTNGLGSVLDGHTTKLDAIYDKVNALTRSTWPGQDKVTLGAEQPLADDLLINGPLHGLLFTITGHPVHNQKYVFGTVTSWARVGAVVFCTDRGDYERSQTFSLDRQVVTPQTMDVAASAQLRLNSGWTGTVRPWTRNA